MKPAASFAATRGPGIRSHKSTAGKRENFRSSVISFFNTITATGIVLHHTAVIPGEKNSAPQRARYRRISSSARLRNLVFRSRLPCGLSLPHYARRQGESWADQKGVRERTRKGTTLIWGFRSSGISAAKITQPGKGGRPDQPRSRSPPYSTMSAA